MVVILHVNLARPWCPAVWSNANGAGALRFFYVCVFVLRYNSHLNQ